MAETDSLFDGIHHEFEYDSKGRKTVDSCYNRNGSLREKFEWRHDEKGNVLEERYYDSDNLLYLTREFEYDEKNQKVGMSAFDREGLRINETSYDLSGNVVKSVDYRGGHIHLMEKFEFVENLLKFHFRYNYREGELGYIHRYEMNHRGERIEEIIYDERDWICSIETYKLDEKGRILEKTRLANVERRRIKYYSEDVYSALTFGFKNIYVYSDESIFASQTITETIWGQNNIRW